MFKTTLIAPALIVASSLPAAAVSLNLSFGASDAQEPLTASAGGVEATFSNATAGQSDLNISSGLNGLTSDGVCAGQGAVLGLLGGCGDTLQVDFSDPVNNLAFDITGIELLTQENFSFTQADGTVIEGSDSDLIDLSLFGEPILGTTVETELANVTQFTFSTDSLVGVNQGYVGDIRFDVAADDGGPAPIPLPAGLPLIATGLGAMGLAGVRRQARG